MRKKPSPSPLADRLAKLEISSEELSQLVRRSEEDVAQWLTAETLGGEAAVLVRFLADAEDALRRVAQLRRTYTRRNLQGDGERQAGVSPPYGNNDIDKITGGVS